MTPDAHDRAAPRPEDVATGPGPGPEAAAAAAANPYARTRRIGPFVVIEVSGEIDVASAGLVAEHLTAATTGSAEPDVLVDLRHVSFFDCSGLRVLCRAEAAAAASGGRLRLVSDQPRMHRLLRAARLLGRFPPLPDLPPVPPPSPPPPQRPSLK
ncbi:anti-sigma factor antagonist [Streptomyces europaeiscabiei]|uniref:anti-sigma factor antagonist n=1 Tax=Streptomyces europaeiscabiei TaxID=146819 RepID=UPI0029AC7F9C|nr:anti-sigma factor antagonist [Streptomyces europaeiscabiei]MDX3580820.1 anti-sigma factor antagonist [Streptomyces europaeiscabiei]MDX3630931.1 anti-sigma factor antagonist [Streptomyces europaeiscabiei]MDX3649055.1 anti-sigma factor antagonist [Streptomyces europaeiscabiei]WUD37416.1 anti-sigma factor antagonist [Streptomyces europaeiscabiei]